MRLFLFGGIKRLKLVKTNITNFRSIKNCTVINDKISALVGENNSGKSAVLRALNSFFNYEQEENNFWNGIQDRKSVV